MFYYVLKLVISAALIVLVSEVSKRYSMLGGLLASLPLVSFLGMIWLYIDTGNGEKVANLSWSILWLVLPSLLLFVLLPILLERQWNFWLSLKLSTLAMFIGYGLMMLLMRRVGWLV